MSDQVNNHGPFPSASSRERPGSEAMPDLRRALASVIDLSAGELEAVLCEAEAQRPGMRQALCAAFEAEAHRLAELSRRAFEAADHLVAHRASAE